MMQKQLYKSIRYCCIACYCCLCLGSFAFGAEQTLQKQTSQLLRSAEQHIENLAYENAALDLMRILDLAPDSPRSEEILFKLAGSFFFLGYYHSADETYRTMLRRFRNAQKTPDGILGLQKCRYRLGDEQQSLKFYNALETNYGTFKGIPESRYYAGQTYYNTQKFSLAYNILHLVDRKSDVYHFALYTSALIHLKRKNMRNAIEALLDVIALSAKTVEQIEIVDAARLTLGYINFELSRFESIQRFVSQISPAFYDYANALLLQAWTSYKLSDFQNCLTLLSKMMTGFKEHPAIPEAHFLTGQCYLRLGYYPFAVTEFEMLLQMIPEQSEIASQVSDASTQIITSERELAALKQQDKKLQLQLVTTFSHGDTAAQKSVRDALLIRLSDGKKQIQQIEGQILAYRKIIEESETQKNWRAYAEYGRVRAMYLDNIVVKE